jgi:type III secretion protein R
MSDPWTTIALLVGLSLLPLLLVVLSSFAKIAIVLTILKNALGASGIPPTLVITALAALLTGFIMAPVASAVVEQLRPEIEPEQQGHAPDEAAPSTPAAAPPVSGARFQHYARAFERAAGPIRQFLEAHARPEDRRAFAELARTLRSDDSSVSERDLLVLAPAFVASELRAAFLIGIAVLIPFLIIDLVVANSLVVLGLTQLPVATIDVRAGGRLAPVAAGAGRRIYVVNGQVSTADWLLEWLREGLFLALLISAPMVLSAVFAGLLVSILQAATQISEPSLPFAPKMAAAIVALAISSPWIVRQFHEFTLTLLMLIPRLGHG